MLCQKTWVTKSDLETTYNNNNNNNNNNNIENGKIEELKEETKACKILSGHLKTISR
jgi:hypothetical protein